jgi:ribonuclease-3
VYKININYEEFERRLKYKFNKKNYILTALTHSSFANETKGLCESNERLEFLGDSVLSLVVSVYIFSHYPSLPEGDLTKLRSSLVCEKTLCEFSKSIDVSKFLIMSKGEKSSKGNELPSVLADAFEAIIAAIYLDGGIKKARDFILRFILPEMKKPKINNLEDYKTILQEVVQRNPEEKLSYVMVGQNGPDHAKQFWSEVRINDKVIGKGMGKSKKEAQQQAAKQALTCFKNKNLNKKT